LAGRQKIFIENNLLRQITNDYLSQLRAIDNNSNRQKLVLATSIFRRDNFMLLACCQAKHNGFNAVTPANAGV
jgi:hypothetical protein